MSTAQLLANRTARRRSIAEQCTADILAALRPFSQSRRVRLSGMATAAAIREQGIYGAIRTATAARRAHEDNGT